MPHEFRKVRSMVEEGKRKTLWFCCNCQEFVWKRNPPDPNQRISVMAYQGRLRYCEEIILEKIFEIAK